MKLGVVKIYKNWKKLTTIVSYQTPKRPSFFQYVILNAIANYPDKEKSLANILRDELQIFNHKIYAECLKDLIEKENTIEINSQGSLNYLANTYAEQEWIDRAIGIFYISKEALQALEKGYLLSKNNNREATIDFIFDIFTNERYINNEHLLLIEKINNNALTIFSEHEVTITGDDLFKFLEKYKTSPNKYNMFNNDTTFTSIRKQQQTIKHDNKEVNKLLSDVYETKEVVLTLTTFKDIKMQVMNDKNLQEIIDNNINLRTKILDYFLTTMTEDLTTDFNLNIQKIAANTLESDYQQDPRHITSTLINPRILIINAANVNPKAVLNHKYYFDNDIRCVIFVNADHSTKISDLTASIPIFYLDKTILPIHDHFLTLFINDKNETECYALQPTELIMLNRKIITAQKFLSNYSNLLFKKILQNLQTVLKNEQGNIYETIHGNKVNDLFIYCYLIDLLNQNDNAFDDILKNISTNNFQNKISILSKCEQILTNFTLRPNYFTKMHTLLITAIKQEAKDQQNIVKAYQVLTNNDLLASKEALNMLQELYHQDNVTLKQLLELTNVASSTTIEKIWNQNLFAILTKFLFALNNDNLHHELFEEISTTNLSKNITLLVNLYGYAEEYLKYFTEMKKRETSNLQRHWEEIWTKVAIISERFKNINHGDDLTIELLGSLSQLETRYKAIKFKDMFNSEPKFQEYLDFCYFDKAALYLINILEEKITAMLKAKDHRLKAINEKLFVCKDLLDKSKQKQIMTIYYELRLYLYCEKARDERNDNKNRDALKKLQKEIEEVLN
ncbi:hypothetical protein [Spiroplasma sp. hyd1]|uniref:hypothetical protein n=1 Tax=Spiroplasma sp. hyd1 TaxID=1609976 RepID=UPI0018DC46D1|nr:hypothetical protein [Spiroplasma sp. hyd1]MBH8622976.1 hypothetical protein [Spiroplasma sp. hyd1]